MMEDRRRRRATGPQRMMWKRRGLSQGVYAGYREWSFCGDVLGEVERSGSLIRNGGIAGYQFRLGYECGCEYVSSDRFSRQCSFQSGELYVQSDLFQFSSTCC